MPVHPHILVANEPAAYRDMLGSEVPRLRPHLAILLVDPADLDAAVVNIRPRLVICSELTEIVRQHAIASIVLYPEGRNEAILDIAGEKRTLPNPELTDLLMAVDAAVSHGPKPGAAQRTRSS